MKSHQTSLHLRADPTRAKIIKAARKLFVERGFAGTSLGNIASNAQINHSLIFHHFGNKEGLWKAVKQNIVEEANKVSLILPKINQPFATFLKKLFQQNILFYRKNPDIIRMIAWQRLEHNENNKDIGVSLSNTTKQWLDAIKHYQNEGEINSTLKCEFIFTLILSVISSAAMDPNIFIKKEADLNKYINFTIDVLLTHLTQQN